MPRLLGVDIPNDKPSVISLTYLYGVGPKVARDLSCSNATTPLKARCGGRYNRASTACGTSNAIAASVTGWGYPYVGSGRGPMPVRARDRGRPWRARRV
jgi:hypothetical protein